MRVAVISDIHGNCLALEAVLADIAAQGVDMTLNLGDLVSGPIEPRRTVDLLMRLGLPTLAGNHERYLTTYELAKLGAVDRFTIGELGPAHLAWMAALPKTQVIADTIFMCHGTPHDDSTPWLDNWFRGRDVTLPDEAAVTALAQGADYPVLLCGHTHEARAARLADGRLVVNPGSVGLQCYRGLPDARYAIIEQRGGVWSVDFRAVPYDCAAAGRLALANGFPRWVEALTTGWASADGLF